MTKVPADYRRPALPAPAELASPSGVAGVFRGLDKLYIYVVIKSYHIAKNKIHINRICDIHNWSKQ
ncbi:MAG: hypothetical protein GY765_21725 [bacterium]|nr:hypothetical protein [bacterium]